MLVENTQALPLPGRAWRLPFGVVAATALLAVAVIALFWDGLAWMWTTWMITPEYSHGVIIPFISAFLVWQRKDRIERQPMTGSWAGVALVALGVIVNLSAALRHVQLVRLLSAGTWQPGKVSATAVALALVLAAIGIAMAVYLVVMR